MRRPASVSAAAMGWLGLLLAAFVPFALVEAGLRVADWQPEPDPHLAGFADDEGPIFTEADGEVTVAPRHRRTWRAEPFPADPPPGAARAFSVGDSVTWGHRGNEHPDPLRSYSEVLQGLLRARPAGSGEGGGGHGADRVVNCGARTFATTRVERVARQMLEQAPSAVIAYVGTSEHLEDMLRAQLRWQREVVPGWMKGLRLMQLLMGWVRPGSDGLTLAGLRERDAALRAPFVAPDAVFAGDGEADRRELVGRAERNLTAIADACQARGVPLVLATVTAHLRFPPFATRLAASEDQAPGEAIIRRAGELLGAGRAEEALALVAPAAVAHPEAAGLHFRLAEIHEQLGDLAAARESYQRARETDACPLRVLGALNDAIRRLAREHPGVALADVERLFEGAVPDGIPDDRLFLDHNHPTPEGHELIARELLRVMAEAGLL